MRRKVVKEPPIAIDDIVARNVALVRNLEKDSHERRSNSQVFSEAVARFCGDPKFLSCHLIACVIWLVGNAVLPFRVDPPPYHFLTLFVALEAIFLSMFILISQNRIQQVNEERAHIDLQINMLAEQESSHMLEMLMEIKAHLGMNNAAVANQDQAVALSEVTDVQKLIEQVQESGNPIPD